MTSYAEYITEHGYTPRAIVAQAETLARESSPLEWNLGDYMDHLSPSSLAQLRRCPRQFQQQRLFGRKSRPGEAPVVGSAVHKALERNFEAKIDTHEDMPLPELLDWFSDVGFDTVVDLEQVKSGQEVWWDSDPESAKTRGRVMLAEYHQFISPRIQPIAVEGKIEVDLGAPVPIWGRFDIEEATRVIDIKTGKRSYRKPKDDWLLQGAVYNAARGLPVEFHSVSATVAKNAVTIVTGLDSEELIVNLTAGEIHAMREVVRGLAARAILFMELYGLDQAWPTEGRFHEWACDRRYCSFRSDCPAWAEP